MWGASKNLIKLPLRGSPPTLQLRGFARTRGHARNVPMPAKSIEDSWVAVKDDNTGLMYWWNEATNQTTAVGAPKPTTAYLTTPNQDIQQTPTFGQTLKEGFAFGAGAGIARGVIGSMFGGWGGGSNDNGGDDSGWV